MMLIGCVMGTILPSKLLHMATAATATAGSGAAAAAAVTSVGVGMGRGYRHYRTLAGKPFLCIGMLVIKEELIGYFFY